MALPLPPVLKSPYIMGSAGVVGVGGISAASLAGRGGGVDYSKNLQENSIRREHLVTSLATAGQLETKCVQEFFGEGNTFSFSRFDFSSDNTLSTPKSPTVSEPQGNTTGCSYIQFSSKSQEAFIFQTETIVKNDKVGLALFSFGSNVINDVTQSEASTLVSKTNDFIMYYLFFLEKEEKSWKIKGGYSWADRRFSGGFKGVKLHLKSPSGNVDVNRAWSGIKEGIDYKDDEWKHEMYYGKWEGSGSSGQEVFEGIELWSDNKEGAEILGRDYSKTFVETKSGKGYEDIWTATHAVHKYEYKVTGGNSNRWHIRSKLPNQDAQWWYVETLDNWYAPFKGIKGTWAEKPISSPK